MSTKAEFMQPAQSERDLDIESDVVDVSGVDLATLATLPANAFGEALRRAVRESEQQPAASHDFEKQLT